MQTTIYYGEEDKYLIDLLDKLARRERKSRSAMILTILEDYFERDKRLGDILMDMGYITQGQLEEALEQQRKDDEYKPLGQILVERGWITKDAVERALTVQSRFQTEK
jgi:predicted transcriptional regulator